MYAANLSSRAWMPSGSRPEIEPRLGDVIHWWVPQVGNSRPVNTGQLQVDGLTEGRVRARGGCVRRNHHKLLGTKTLLVAINQHALLNRKSSSPGDPNRAAYIYALLLVAVCPAARERASCDRLDMPMATIAEPDVVPAQDG
jgi:hypothetical protein